jgi:serine/threonine-protein kinase
MAQSASDCDLLFGLLALQIGLIDQGQLVAAFQAWTRDRSHPLADRLISRGDLDPEQRSAVELLVALHLKKHGDSTEKSLAVIPVGHSTRESLAEVSDPEFDATLAHIGSSIDSVSGSRITERGIRSPQTPDDRTDRIDDNEHSHSFAVGSATSEGQRFRVLRPHARGGLGTVFVALDSELHREVALKQILDAHADDPLSRTRFVMEAEITGGLEHPGVVPVYGLGTDTDGRPYYAMRFIKGDSLKEAVVRFRATGSDPGRHSLEFRHLLRRFLDVCNAIDYAHSRGVIHRDLKPANIVLGKHGETLVVDWGLAKAVGRADPSVGEQTLAPASSGSSETLPGSAMGTPSYMSPEQARGELDLLGPRSDVYSLGATLYYLLTGKPPFESKDVASILRDVKAGRFLRPSQREPALDRALEAICLKAMSTQPEERYASAVALADDLERWMADEPVVSWREPFSRRARRWVRRNRTAVTALAASVLVALAGTAAVLAVQTQANAQLRSVNTDLGIANIRISMANADLKSANGREKQRFVLAMDAIKLFHGDVSEDLLLKEKQFESLRIKLLKGAAGFYDRLEDLLKSQPDRESRTALGNAYEELATLTGEISDQTAALAVHRKALAVRQTLAAEPAADEGTKLAVARSLTSVGDLQQARGEMPEARASFEEARRLAEEAERRGWDPEQVQVAMGRAQLHLANLLARTEDRSEARTAYLKALVIRQQLVDAFPTVLGYQEALATVYNNFAYLLFEMGDVAGSREAYEKGLVLREKLVESYSDDTDFQRDAAWSFLSLGQLLSYTGDPSRARSAFDKALTIRQKLADVYPRVSSIQAELARAYLSMGWFLLRSDRPGESLEHFAREEAIWKRLVDANPSVGDYRSYLANCHLNTALALLRLGRLAEARTRSERAVALYQVLVNDHPASPDYRCGFAESLLRFGQVRQAERDLVGASANWRRAIAQFKSIRTMNGEFVFCRAACHALLSAVAGMAGSEVSADDREIEAGQAMALLRRAVAMGYRDPSTYRTETALDSLRLRPDFQLLMMDLSFPADPFVRVD